MEQGQETMPEHLSPVREPESPRHGYRGERRPAGQPFLPAGLCVAVSREAGSRGTSIARRAAEKLGWQLYTQEMLEFMAQDPAARQEVAENLSPAAAHWVEEHLERLGEDPGREPIFTDMARNILALGAAGEVVLIGRGAGCILPRASTLNVRVLAPLEDRVAYLGQWLGLDSEEAAAQVRLRDARRAQYWQSNFRCDVAEVYQYDLLVNSTHLGEDLSAELLARAARAKLTALTDADA
jgi:cytidylate kinase